MDRGKKGQVGDVIATFPVLIAVFLIMLVFVVLSAFASNLLGLGKESIKPEIVSLDNSDFLLKQVDVNIDGKMKRLLVFDEIVVLEKQKLFFNGKDVRTFFDNIMVRQERNTCLLIYKGAFLQSSLVYQCEVVKDSSQGKESVLLHGEKNICKGFTTAYQNEGIIKYYGESIAQSYFSVNRDSDQENIHLFYYYGECLHNTGGAGNE